MNTSNVFSFRTLVIGFLLTLLAAPVAFADLSEIQEQGYAVFVMSGEYPPFSMPDADGNMIGFDADVARELAARLGVEPRLQQAEFSSIIAGIQTGAFDVTVASHARTAEREGAVTFSEVPYYYGGGQMFVNDSTDFQSLDDLREANAAIAVDLGGTNQQWLEENDYPNVDTYSGVQDSLLAVASGRAAAIFTNPIVGYLAIQEGQPLRAIEGLLFEENAWITVANNQPDLIAAINQALEDMREDGTLLEISMEWIGGDIVTPQ